MKMYKERQKKRKWVITALLLLACVFLVPATGIQAEAAATCSSGISYPGTTTDKVNMRKKAGTQYKSYGKISKGQEVTILGYVTNGGTTWYKCKAKVGGKTRTGYICAAYVAKKSKPTGVVNKKVATYLNVRKSAKTSSKSLMKITKGTKVTILGIKKVSGKYWYRIKTTYNKKTKTGYVMAKYITVSSTSDTTTEEDKNDTPLSEEEFEVMLASFPESYKAGIRALHTTYPNWRFVAINTDLDWGTVITNESVVGRNVIQSNYPKGTNSLAPFSYLSTAAGAYDWATDTYTIKDGSNWYSASSEVIAYYMDPRNFLNDMDIFQFEALAYDASQSSTVVQSILNNTFMSGNYSVVDSATKTTVSGSYQQAFMDAGKTAQANPYFLASRSKQEVGVNGSNATSGTYKGYEGIYNFYNIGASDGGDAVAKGLLWAKGGTSGATTYGRPWTNPYKSIVGGAQYIAKNYINVGQNTLYFQKFNVKPNDATYLYMHQYMTNVQAPYSEGRTTRAAYNAIGILSDTMIFYIPVYNNMPASACQLPATAGNPNPYLSGIELYSGNTILSGLTPTFSYNIFNYSIVVPANVASVTVSASAVSSKASVSGLGTYTLGGSGTTTTITVVGVAQNGAQQPYTINVTRQ
ncbi:MAG: SH3 domain-containing protein [Lachnospiraceae bacterium]